MRSRLPTLTNKALVEAFVSFGSRAGKNSSRTLSIQEQFGGRVVLCSYGRPIWARLPGGIFHPIADSISSQTTSKHRNLVKRSLETGIKIGLPIKIIPEPSL